MRKSTFNSLLAAFIALSGTVSHAQTKTMVVAGKLENQSGGYLLTIELSGIPLMVNVSQSSAQKFGECSQGKFILNLENKDADGGVIILDMQCAKKSEPSVSCQKTEELSTPVSMYSSSTGAYFVATDTCMRDSFAALGMKEAIKPKDKEFSNVFFTGVSFSSAVPVYSEQLKMFGEVGQFNIDGKLVIENLGFKVIPFDSKIEGVKKDDLLKWRFRVCNMGDDVAPSYKSCLAISDRLRAQF